MVFVLVHHVEGLIDAVIVRPWIVFDVQKLIFADSSGISIHIFVKELLLFTVVNLVLIKLVASDSSVHIIVAKLHLESNVALIGRNHFTPSLE